MKTLVIISHPDLVNSSSQRFLRDSVAHDESVTLHHLDSCYPDGKIDAAKELALLKEHQRIIFQFPLYWYSSPALLKEWQDVVLSQGEGKLQGKEFGLVITIGVAETAYRVGGKEGQTIDRLTAPYQSVARYFGMNYLPNFCIYQFAYLTEEEQLTLVTDYHYYLTGPKSSSLKERTEWLLQELEKSRASDLADPNQETLTYAQSHLLESYEEIAELDLTLAEFD